MRLLAAAQAHLVAGDGTLAEALLDQAAPQLAEAGLHAEAQRLRAAIAVFFSGTRTRPPACWTPWVPPTRATRP